MDRGRGGRNDFFGGFGDPFGGFGDPFGGFGDHRSLASSFFGGRDPFDDPFFTRPFGGMFGSNMFGPSMIGQGGGFLGGGSPFHTGFIDNQQPSQGNNRSHGPIIEEILSGDEGDEQGEGVEEKKQNPRKHSRSSRDVPIVEEPDDGTQERRIRHMQNRNDFNRMHGIQPQTQSFSFQSSSVTYGGTNGAYYTSSTTRKMGDNGVMIEEKKEADTTTGKAEHRISKGIRDKGHTVTRKLNPDGKVDTMQTLHNLNENEIPGFEESWKGNAKKHLPGWNERNDVYGNIGSSSSSQHMQASRQGWALPSTEKPSVPNKTAPHKAYPSTGRG
ncbi:myeloid leukemia factor [Thalictrum thalictroides]|uniref:Myeloid leukemia factor n=1 Tax=Thalictrum thalictroides TaxID=46969 RepID=A0A7J6XCX7_THATH|nr:myeloid leukemia factor [Thalictrum thalictroides]